MSGYGHADKIAAIAVGASAAGGEKPTPPIDRRLYDRPEVGRILAERDIAGLYRALNGAGVSQRRIAELTGSRSLRSARSSRAAGCCPTTCWCASPMASASPAS